MAQMSGSCGSSDSVDRKPHVVFAKLRTRLQTCLNSVLIVGSLYCLVPLNLLIVSFSLAMRGTLMIGHIISSIVDQDNRIGKKNPFLERGFRVEHGCTFRSCGWIFVFPAMGCSIALMILAPRGPCQGL